MARRIYIDTFVVAGCIDETFGAWSNRLMDEIRDGWWLAVVSDLTERELLLLPSHARQIVNRLPGRAIERVKMDRKAKALAEKYIFQEVVSQDQIAVAQHVATATVSRVDVFVSWNFRQIVNLDRIRAFNAVNLMAGYPMLEIRTPREVFHEENL